MRRFPTATRKRILRTMQRASDKSLSHYGQEICLGKAYTVGHSDVSRALFRMFFSWDCGEVSEG